MVRRLGIRGDEIDPSPVMSARRTFSLAAIQYRQRPCPATMLKMYAAQRDLLLALNRQLMDLLSCDPPPNPDKKLVLHDQCWRLHRELEQVGAMINILNQKPVQFDMKVVKKM